MASGYDGPPAVVPPVAFTPVAAVDVGNSPESVALGDVNGDGQLDLVTALRYTDDVSVMLGNGAGGFAAAADSPFVVGNSPRSVVLGDVNGDGHLDLVTANSLENDVSVLLGAGTGGFAAAPGSPVAVGNGNDSPRSVDLGDVNGDGRLDLVTANYNQDNVTVLLGAGTGGFTKAPGSPFAVGATTPTSVVLADVNGDGRLDLATANEYSHTVSVLLGDGTAGFTAATGSPFATAGTNSFPGSVVSGDVNGDGRVDLVTTNFNRDNVSVLLAQRPVASTVSFAVPATAAVGAAPYSVVSADVNGDGRLDLVTANRDSDNVSAMHGNSSGGFTAAAGSPFAAGDGPRSVGVGDVNGDGRLDVIAANYNSDAVSVL